MEPLLCYPDPLPAELQAALRQGGYDFRCLNRPELVDVTEQSATKDGWGGAPASPPAALGGGIPFCRHLRRREVPLNPLLLVIAPNQVAELQLRDDIFDKFCGQPARGGGVVARPPH